jgi:hypothetical protein
MSCGLGSFPLTSDTLQLDGSDDVFNLTVPCLVSVALFVTATVTSTLLPGEAVTESPLMFKSAAAAVPDIAITTNDSVMSALDNLYWVIYFKY